MNFLSPIVVAMAVFADPNPPASIESLAAALRVSEELPKQMAGRVTSRFTDDLSGLPAAPAVSQNEYEFAINDNQFFVINTFRKAEAESRTSVCGRSDRLQFTAEQHQGVWGIVSMGPPTESLPAQAGFFLIPYFRVLHSVEDKRLADLLSDSSYVISLRRLGDLETEVTGTRTVGLEPGVARFRATVRTSAGRGYAYIAALHATVESFTGDPDTRWREDVECVNSVSEEADGPRLTKSVTTRSSVFIGMRHRSILDVDYHIRSSVSAEDRERFEPGYYGLAGASVARPSGPATPADPDDDSWTMAQIVVMSCLGIGIVVVGGFLILSRRSSNSPNPDPTRLGA
jgi:hypothetical protein